MDDSKKKKTTIWKRLEGTTNFYPAYVDNNRDKVTPTSAIFRTEFQKVFPRYDLSMTETRDKGTGPTFLETAYQKSKSTKSIKNKYYCRIKKNSVRSSKEQNYNKKKIRIDFWK